MQMDNRLLDDFARIINGALGSAGGLRSEFEGLVRRQLERLLAGMELVPRQEFEAVKAIAAKARAEQEALAERLAKLEARLAEKSGDSAG